MADYTENIERISNVGWPSAGYYLQAIPITNAYDTIIRVSVRDDATVTLAQFYDSYVAGKTVLQGKTTGTTFDFANIPTTAVLPTLTEAPFSAPVFDETGTPYGTGSRPVFGSNPIYLPSGFYIFQLALAGSYSRYSLDQSLSESGPDWQGYLSFSSQEWYPVYNTTETDTSATLASGSGDTITDVIAAAVSLVQGSTWYDASSSGSTLSIFRDNNTQHQTTTGVTWVDTGGLPDTINISNLGFGSFLTYPSAGFTYATFPDTTGGEDVQLITPPVE